MPHLPCSSCGKPLEINIGDQRQGKNMPAESNPSKIIGSALCRECKAGTGFEIVDNVISYVSGKSSYGGIDERLSSTTKALFAEAELSFRHGSPNASVAMCRASLESALAQAGFNDGNLYGQIEKAKVAKALDDIEVGLAHASRLVTRDAIHRGELANLSDVPSMLSTTIRILNKLVSFST